MSKDRTAGEGGESRSPYTFHRGLARGLAILQALNLLREASSLQLAQATGIPRPTVHRILESLRSLGFVSRAHARDAYHLASLVHSLSDGFQNRDWVTEIAEPILDDLFQRFVWPTSVSTFEDGAMVLRANTHRESPLSLVSVRPGTRFPMLTTSIGRVHLAFCPAPERAWILDLLASTAVPAEQRETWMAATHKMLDDVRARGFGIREKRPESRTASLAVPIVVDGRVMACLGIVWMHSALRTADAIDRFFEPMQAAAGEIARGYEALRLERAMRSSSQFPLQDVSQI